MQRIDQVLSRHRASVAYPKPELNPEPKVALRLGGIYRLPDGKELVVGVGRDGRYFLYHPLAWKGRAFIVSLPIEYEIDAMGPVITGRGQPASWRIEDLIDTGRSVD
jgi:hypothetical protein